MKGGTIYGFRLKAVEKPVHVHDIHATILYLMGIVTRSLVTGIAAGISVIDVAGNVLHELVA